MDKTMYVDEVERRIRIMFRSSKEGYKVSAVEKHRLEGFMEAGIFLGIADRGALSRRMNEIHFDIFGMSITERKEQTPNTWSDESIDYGPYEQPTIKRT